MADEEQIKLLKSGVEAWNRFRGDRPDVEINLRRADLRKADLTGWNLRRADLREANMAEAKLDKADLAQASLRDADLRDSDLEGVRGLQAPQLGGAVTSLAKLPREVARFDMLRIVEKASGNARKIFLAMLLGCAYAILTIATTTDARLLANSATSPLPIIRAEIQITGFYLAAPLILFGFYLYFHLCMRSLWERLATLPAQLPDGQTLDKIVDPWLLLGLVRSHFKRLREEQTFFDYLQAWVSIALAWWVVPATLSLLWLRYIRRHDLWVTSWQIALLVAAAVIGVFSYRHAVSTLRGVEQKAFSLKQPLKAWWGRDTLLLAALLGGLFCGLVSASAIHYRGRQGGGVPELTLASLERLARARVSYADLSTKPERWAGGEAEEAYQIELVKPAKLRGANLRGVRAVSTFLVRADLRSADLSYALLDNADLRRAALRHANLTGAHLVGADLRGADLKGANLIGANLTDVNLSEANLASTEMGAASRYLSGEGFERRTDLSSADLSQAKGLTQDQLNAACAKADNPAKNLPEGLEPPPAC